MGAVLCAGCGNPVGLARGLITEAGQNWCVPCYTERHAVWCRRCGRNARETGGYTSIQRRLNLCLPCRAVDAAIGDDTSLETMQIFEAAHEELAESGFAWVASNAAGLYG